MARRNPLPPVDPSIWRGMYYALPWALGFWLLILGMLLWIT